MAFTPPARKPVQTHHVPQPKPKAQLGGGTPFGKDFSGPRPFVAAKQPVVREVKPGQQVPGGRTKPAAKPPLVLQPTTLWDYPSQHYGEGAQGSQAYRGATPSYVIWNMIQRYTEPGETVLDPFCGSGTTLDVARDTGRKGIGFDLNPQRPDIEKADARELPKALSGQVDMVFMDPPYSTHIDYSDDPRCIGKLDAGKDRAYYTAMEKAIAEAHRVLKPGGHFGLYVSDSYEHKGGKGKFNPIGFELFALMQKRFTPVDIISVTRHNRTLEMGNFRAAAEEGNFFLRGFNYLFIVKK